MNITSQYGLNFKVYIWEILPWKILGDKQILEDTFLLNKKYMDQFQWMSLQKVFVGISLQFIGKWGGSLIYVYPTWD